MNKNSTQIPAIEWVAAAVGLLLLAAAITVILLGENRSGRPPEIAVRAGMVQQAGDRWLATFEAHNEGDAAIAGLVVRATLAVGDSTESADTELDYVPAHSSRGGGVFFSRDPRAGRLTFIPLSYRDP